MKQLALEGLDGTGKTTVAHALAEHYNAQNMPARVVAPYHIANERHGGDLYHLWQTEAGALEAVHQLKQVLREETAKAEQDGVEILIFDRHWMTLFVDIDKYPNVVKAWGDTFVPTALLHVAPEVARARAGNDHDAVWMEHENYMRYFEKYKSLFRKYGRHILGGYRNDDDVTINMMVHTLEWDMNIRR